MDWAASPTRVIVEVFNIEALLFNSRRALSTMDRREGWEVLKTSQQ
jgi:hypothetical protein